LTAWQERKFTVVASQPLVDELNDVWQRPRLGERINPKDAERLLEQLRLRSEWVEPVTVPPGRCDPKDHPVLATAIDGHADAIITGDADLRADDRLRTAMGQHGVELWGVDRLFEQIGVD
jgi:putative PIN family toxin of toxin-antitoxin system